MISFFPPHACAPCPLFRVYCVGCVRFEFPISWFLSGCCFDFFCAFQLSNLFSLLWCPLRGLHSIYTVSLVFLRRMFFSTASSSPSVLSNSFITSERFFHFSVPLVLDSFFLSPFFFLLAFSCSGASAFHLTFACLQSHPFSWTLVLFAICCLFLSTHYPLLLQTSPMYRFLCRVYSFTACTANPVIPGPCACLAFPFSVSCLFFISTFPPPSFMGFTCMCPP